MASTCCDLTDCWRVMFVISKLPPELPEDDAEPRIPLRLLKYSKDTHMQKTTGSTMKN